jgi:hypothetical protein
MLQTVKVSSWLLMYFALHGQHISLQCVAFCSVIETRPASWVKLRSYLNEKVAAPGLDNRDWRSWGPVALTTWPQKLALTSLIGGGRSIGIVRSRAKAMEFSLVIGLKCDLNIITRINLKSFIRWLIWYRAGCATDFTFPKQLEFLSSPPRSGRLWIQQSLVHCIKTDP